MLTSQPCRHIRWACSSLGVEAKPGQRREILEREGQKKGDELNQREEGTRHAGSLPGRAAIGCARGDVPRDEQGPRAFAGGDGEFQEPTSDVYARVQVGAVPV